MPGEYSAEYIIARQQIWEPQKEEFAKTVLKRGEYFRFLDLPGELRNRIYTCMFEGKAGEYKLLEKWWDYIPDPAITVVCKQVREESLKLYREARPGVWQDYRWAKYINHDKWDNDYAEEVIRDCEYTPRNAQIREIFFISMSEGYIESGAATSSSEPMPIAFGAVVREDGDVDWVAGMSSVEKMDDETKGRIHTQMDSTERYLRRITEGFGRSLQTYNYPFLDPGKCAWVVVEMLRETRGKFVWK